MLLVEDHAEMCAAIASQFESEPDFEIVGQAGSLAEARELLERADVAILDLGLPDGSGAELIPELRSVNPAARAIVLSAAFEEGAHTRAIERGAVVVLDKLTHLDHVAHAVRRIMAGESPVPGSG